MHTLKTILSILICAAVLAACGLKGPLYLPDENPAGESVEQQPQLPDVKKEEENEGNSGQ